MGSLIPCPAGMFARQGQAAPPLTATGSLPISYHRLYRRIGTTSLLRHSALLAPPSARGLRGSSPLISRNLNSKF